MSCFSCCDNAVTVHGLLQGVGLRVAFACPLEDRPPGARMRACLSVCLLMLPLVVYVDAH